MTSVGTNPVREAEVGRTAELILRMVTAHATDGVYRTTVRSMGGYCQQRKRTVKRGLRRLEADGLIRTEVNADNTGLIVTLLDRGGRQ